MTGIEPVIHSMSALQDLTFSQLNLDSLLRICPANTYYYYLIGATL